MSGSAPRKVGEYELLARLGRGSQGEVWEAAQPSLGRRVALKLLPEHLVFGDETLARFRREASAGGRLSHPHVVTVFAIGEDRGVHYIAEELVPGGRTLADLIAEARAASETPRDWYARIAATIASVADGLHAAHAAGVIHRDIKPSNILLTADGSPKLADFGLALVADDGSGSRTGGLAGTPFYMSPEQAGSGRLGLDARSDVFSLGSTLYEALTLQRPFTGESRERILRGILLDEPVPPRRLAPRLPLDLQTICLHALAKRPERRYASAAELAADLRRFLAHEPIRARAPGPLARGAMWVRRHPVAGMALASLLVTAALLVEARQAREDASTQRDVASEAEQGARGAVEMLAGILADAEHDALVDPVAWGALIERCIAELPGLGARADTNHFMHVLIGRALLRIDEAARAEEFLRRSLDFARAPALAEIGLYLAESSSSLATALRLQGRLGEAREALDAARTAAATMRAPPDLLTGIAREESALRVASGRPEEGVAELERRRAEIVAEEGEDHPAAILLDVEIALLLARLGRLEEGGARATAAVQAGTRAGVPARVRLRYERLAAELVVRKAERAARAGRADEAQALWTLAEADLQRLETTLLAELGPRHGDLGRTLNVRGKVARQLGRLDEARALLGRAVPILEASAGEASVDALSARNNLAVSLYAAGERSAAEQQWLAVARADLERPLHEPEVVLKALSHLVQLLRVEGRFDEALPWAQRLVDRTPTAHPDAAEHAALLDDTRRRRDDAALDAASGG